MVTKGFKRRRKKGVAWLHFGNKVVKGFITKFKARWIATTCAQIASHKCIIYSQTTSAVHHRRLEHTTDTCACALLSVHAWVRASIKGNRVASVMASLPASAVEKERGSGTKWGAGQVYKCTCTHSCHRNSLPRRHCQCHCPPLS